MVSWHRLRENRYVRLSMTDSMVLCFLHHLTGEEASDISSSCSYQANFPSRSLNASSRVAQLTSDARRELDTTRLRDGSKVTTLSRPILSCNYAEALFSSYFDYMLGLEPDPPHSEENGRVTLVSSYECDYRLCRWRVAQQLTRCSSSLSIADLLHFFRRLIPDRASQRFIHVHFQFTRCLHLIAVQKQYLSPGLAPA
jgi:hypothetical protein